MLHAGWYKWFLLFRIRYGFARAVQHNFFNFVNEELRHLQDATAAADSGEQGDDASAARLSAAVGENTIFGESAEVSSRWWGRLRSRKIGS